MKRVLRYTRSASRDIDGVAVYIAGETGDRGLASRFVGQIRVKCRRLAELPGILGTARPDLAPDLRSTPCRGYVIFFRYVGDVLEVVDVLHGSREVLSYFDDMDGTLE